MPDKELVPMPNSEIIQESEVPGLLDQIRPAWQSKHLIERVRRLIQVDPSSACQRVFNASIYDLREKIIVAGIDIARDVASVNRLPPIDKEEDVIEKYSTAKLIDLAYYVGILTRPEWRRILRCYEIRRDLEHEDSEYEAGIEDCVYIFRTCIEAVLAKDPIHLLRVDDVKKIIQQPTPAFPSAELLDDFKHAPPTRQKEICKFIIQTILGSSQPEIVTHNAIASLQQFQEGMHDEVRLDIASYIQKAVGRNVLDDLHVRVAYAAGALPYLRRAQLKDYFSKKHRQMEECGYHWKRYQQHGVLLKTIVEVDGIRYCPEPPRTKILKWLVLAFVGETSFNHPRPVFYSDTAAPLIREIVAGGKNIIRDDLNRMRKDKDIERLLKEKVLARRFEELADLVDK